MYLSVEHLPFLGPGSSMILFFLCIYSPTSCGVDRSSNIVSGGEKIVLKTLLAHYVRYTYWNLSILLNMFPI